MNILILGGDGYLGWSTAMHLSRRGHSVGVVDNYLRRNMSREIGVEPLLDAPNLHERTSLWKGASGYDIDMWIGDVTDWEFLSRVFREFGPDCVVHYAEQPSAPYSMMDRRRAQLTLSNNLESTLNLAYAVREFAPSCHIVKLGTMGEYGTPNIDIEEGYLDVSHNGRSQRFLFPKLPGSIYHLTKVQDSDLLYFTTRTWDLRITDLNQGPVYGIMTEECAEDDALAPLFSYDGVFGTVLNRFLVQAVAGHPLTVYGKGGQVRGYLNIIDTLACVELAVNNPVEPGEFRVFNQFTETFSVNDLAAKVKSVGDAMGLNVSIKNIPNPRRELEEHYYNPKNTGLLELGLTPHLLTDERLAGMIEFVRRHADRIRPAYILPSVKWT